MSFDIKRVVRQPFQRLERPVPNAGISNFKKIGSRLVNQAINWLLLLTVFITPLWLGDGGGALGSGRALVFTILAGLVLGLYCLQAAWLEEKISGQHTLLNFSLVFIIISSAGAAVVGADPAASLGLSDLSGAPLWPAVVFGLGLLFIIYQRAESPAYWLSLGGSFSAGVTLLAFYILGWYFWSGSNNLPWVADEWWLTVFALNIFFLTAWSVALRRGWQLAALAAVGAQLAILFLWADIGPFVLVIAGLSCLLLCQIIFARRLEQSRFLNLALVWILAVALLVILIFFFSQPVRSSYRAAEVWQEWQASSWRQWLAGSGPGRADSAMRGSALSFYDPAPEAKAAVPPTEKNLAGGAYSWVLEGGIFGLLAWLSFMVIILLKNIKFFRQYLSVLAGRNLDQPLYLAVTMSLGALLLLAGVFISGWTMPVFLALLVWVGVGLGLERQFTAADTFSFVLTQNSRPLWLARLVSLFVILLVLFFALAGIKTWRAAKAAASAGLTAEPGKALLLWQTAAALNPYSEFYRIKRVEARFQTMNESTDLPEQREIIEDVNATLAKIVSAGRNPLSPWLAARLYARLQKYAEGSDQLARLAYLKAGALWPSNVVIAAELARFYREEADRLVSTDLTVSDLQAEAEGWLRRALKNAPDYLSARLELAFILEKQNGIPAAVAELEPWEEQSPEIMYHVGRLYFNDNKLEVARDKFLAVLEQIPSHANAHYSLGVAYFRQGLYKEALAEFEKVEELNPGSADVAEKIEEVKKKIK